MKHNEKKKISAEEKLQKGQMINKKIVLDATLQSLVKLNPKVQIKNPVMFVVYLGAIFTMILFFLSLGGIKDGGSWYIFGISIILWFTSLFGNFAEAIAEGRGRAQAESLKKARRDVIARTMNRNTRKSRATNSNPEISSSSKRANKSPWTAKSSSASPA